MASMQAGNIENEREKKQKEGTDEKRPDKLRARTQWARGLVQLAVASSCVD